MNFIEDHDESNTLRMDYSITVLMGESSFHDIKPEWDDLWECSTEATQFQRWEWQYHYYKNITPEAPLKIIVARDSSGRCVALTAISKVVDSTSGLKKISFVGDLGADYHLILSKPDLPIELGHKILDFLCNSLNLNASIIDLSNIPEGSWTQKAAMSYFNKNIFPPELLFQKESQTYAVLLPLDLETYLQQLGNRSQKAFSYDRRRLGREFLTTWQTFSDEKDLDKCFIDIESIDRARWGNDSQYCSPNRRAFLHSVAYAQAKANMYLAFLLYLNGTPSAYVKGAVVRNSYKVESIGHVSEIAKHLSIGKTMNFYAIEACIKIGLLEFDLTRGAESYKKWLGGKPRNNFHFRLYRNRLTYYLNIIFSATLEFVRKQTWLRRIYQRYARGRV